MRLMVFDLDTALCQASTMDGLAMAGAIQDVTDREINPETIRSISDLKTLWYQATGVMPTAADLKALRDRFAFHLRRQFIIRPSVVSANYPVVEAVNRLQNQSDTLVAIVSVASEAAVSLKARAIGLHYDTLPLATGDDSDQFDGLLKTVQVRVRRGFGFRFDQAQLIAGSAWASAAERRQMAHVSLPIFINRHAAAPRSNLFQRFRSRGNSEPIVS